MTGDDKGTRIQVNEKFTAYIGQALSLLCPQITVPEFEFAVHNTALMRSREETMKHATEAAPTIMRFPSLFYFFI